VVLLFCYHGWAVPRLRPHSLITPNRRPILPEPPESFNRRHWKILIVVCHISRMGVARIELGHTRVNDTVLEGLLRVFRLPIVLFFPQEIQDLDADYAKRIADQMPNPVSTKKSRKCQKLTKKRPPI
jgi:hypothetical protein